MDASGHYVEGVQTKVSWIPVTPLKPSLVPICTSAGLNEATSLGSTSFSFSTSPSHPKERDTCLQSSTHAGTLSMSNDQVVSSRSTTTIPGDDYVRTNAEPPFDMVNFQHMRCGELLALAEAASQIFTGRDLSGNNDLKDYSFTSFSQYLPETNSGEVFLPNLNHSPQPPQTNSGITRETNGLTTTPLFSNSTLNFAPTTPEKAGNSNTPGLQITFGVSIGQEIGDNSASVFGLDGTPHRDEMSAKHSVITESPDVGKGGSLIIDLNETPKQKPKRKKHRPKVVVEGKPKRGRKPITPIPDESDETQAEVKTKRNLRSKTPISDGSDEKPKEKRIYVRRKKRDRCLTTPVNELTSQTTTSDGSDEKPKEKRIYVRRKKRDRSLTTPVNELASQTTTSMKFEPAKKSCRMSLNFDIEHLQDESCAHNPHYRSSCGIPTQAQVGFDYNLICENQMSKDKSSLIEKQIPGSPSTEISATWTTGLVKEQSERKHSAAFEHADTSRLNLVGSHYNGITAYQTIWAPFPKILRKKRSGMVHNLDTNPAPDASDIPPASSFSGCELKANQVPVASKQGENALQDNFQTLGCILALNTKERSKKKRSKAATRARDLGSLAIITNFNVPPNHLTFQQDNGGKDRVQNAQRQKKCIDDLLAQTCATLTRKKRSKTRSSSQTSPHCSQHHALILSNQMITDAPRIPWNQTLALDSLTEQFESFDINRDVSQSSNQENKALVPHHVQNEQNALVLYRGNGSLVPFNRKRKPRPKVDLDEETNKVWKLLMENIENPGISGTDEEKAQWWEKERSVFQGRADSFIARMHLVQGDRRFTPWKGSVVDSVVGVFLTQNVSDHLSSSAFMSLAARFPLKSNCNSTSCNEQKTNMVVEEPAIHVLEPDDSIKSKERILTQLLYGPSSVPTNDTENSEEKEIAKSNDSSRDGSCVISLQNETNHGQSFFATTEDIVLSQNSAISFQRSGDSTQHADKMVSCSDSNSDAENLLGTAKHVEDSSFVQLLEMASVNLQYEATSRQFESWKSYKDTCNLYSDLELGNITHNLEKSVAVQVSKDRTFIHTSDYALPMTPTSRVDEVPCFQPLKEDVSSKYQNKKWRKPSVESAIVETVMQSQSILPIQTKDKLIYQEANNNAEQNAPIATKHCLEKSPESNTSENRKTTRKESGEIIASAEKKTDRRTSKGKRVVFDWEHLRKKAQANGRRERTETTMDSVDWEAVKRANVKEIAEAIRERGMNNMLAERIKDFLDRLVEEYGSIDLEWMRDIPPDQAKEYLLSIRGLGLKSVECVRLLTLHHLAFPVDTNVGRIAVRLGWVPLQPLPESLQLHLLELYPVLESIQKYLWPRLCKLDQKTLYELHYQLITFGKVFCTKSKPNCNACPMRGECRHFASAFASARLSLPGPEHTENLPTDQIPSIYGGQSPLPLPQPTWQANESQEAGQWQTKSSFCQPIIEEPASPEPECQQISEHDMEDACYESEFPTINLDIEEFTLNLQNYMQKNMELQEGEMSKALVALTPEVASIPMPKLKNVNRLRTEHYVYELPDSHPLLDGLDKLEPDDPGKYLLAIWTPGETADSIQPPESKCSSAELGELCSNMECFSCNNIRETNSQVVRGTLLIPCRTAMRGSFPLNGTYFQVNEVFADHDSSLNPINVPRSLIWNLHRRTVYFGTSMPTIFKGLSTKEIQGCFWKGYVCVRGFDRTTKAPRPLIARLHFPASKLNGTKAKKDDE